MSLTTLTAVPAGANVRGNKGFGGAILKRAVDLVASSLLLVVVSPAFALIALLISLDGGPIFFVHRRIGRNGKPFHCLKFRTMMVGAEDCLTEFLAFHPIAARQWHEDQKLSRDPRITGIGKLLRRTSLDELPQLLNVLRGEMSLVGPRPVTETELAEQYGSYAHFYTSVKPGITGLWQISGRNNLSYTERVALDVRYVNERSLGTDIAIIYKTAAVVLSRSGAY